MPYGKQLKRDTWVVSYGSTLIRKVSVMVRRGLFHLP